MEKRSTDGAAGLLQLLPKPKTARCDALRQCCNFRAIKTFPLLRSVELVCQAAAEVIRSALSPKQRVDNHWPLHS
jgi:hypothetical protein